jgi:hypothetical protein
MRDSRTRDWMLEHPLPAAVAVVATLGAPTVVRLWQGVRLLGGRRPRPLPPVEQPVYRGEPPGSAASSAITSVSARR